MASGDDIFISSDGLNNLLEMLFAYDSETHTLATEIADSMSNETFNDFYLLYFECRKLNNRTRVQHFMLMSHLKRRIRQ